jgi:hypothetical protein
MLRWPRSCSLHAQARAPESLCPAPPLPPLGAGEKSRGRKIGTPHATTMSRFFFIPHAWMLGELLADRLSKVVPMGVVFQNAREAPERFKEPCQCLRWRLSPPTPQAETAYIHRLGAYQRTALLPSRRLAPSQALCRSEPEQGPWHLLWRGEAPGDPDVQGGEPSSEKRFQKRQEHRPWRPQRQPPHGSQLSLSRFMVYDASHERRPHRWPVYGSPTCRPAQQRSWI